jgi:hypothetical protein
MDSRAYQYLNQRLKELLGQVDSAAPQQAVEQQAAPQKPPASQQPAPDIGLELLRMLYNNQQRLGQQSVAPQQQAAQQQLAQQQAVPQPVAQPGGPGGMPDLYTALMLLQHQANMANMIQATFNRIYQMNEDMAARMHDTTMRVSQEWINAFSGRDPITGLPHNWPW